MLDFLTVNHRQAKGGGFEIYPKFRVDKNKDLMIRGGDFYAIWVEEKGLWSTSEFDAIRMIDQAMDDYAKNNSDILGECPHILYMWDSDTGMIDRFHKYCQKQLRDNYSPLDEHITFLDEKTSREDYRSKRLPYPLRDIPTPSWDRLLDTLYNPDERNKIEWAIGSVVAGASVDLQKFFVFYGSGGTGKSTILNIIDSMFEGYSTTFSSESLGNSNSAFALESFSNNPLVAIDQEGNLSKINDNTRLNALVSHDKLRVNEKFKSTYENRFKCLLFIGTNSPVKITDSRSGLIRRLIDIEPSGRLLEKSSYDKCVEGVQYELGGIALKCRDRYISNPRMFDHYTPTKMIIATNDFFNFVTELYLEFGDVDTVPLNVAYTKYKTYVEDYNIKHVLSKTEFRGELETYFERCDLHDPNDPKIGITYSGFKADKFKSEPIIIVDEPEDDVRSWLEFKEQESIFDQTFADTLAQYTEVSDKGQVKPKTSWDLCKTTLKDINTHELHYVKVPLSHVVVDLDIPDESGNKSFELNYEAALKFPPTYAELSKSGAGIHLHYYYEGDPEELLRKYDDHIEIKVFTGKSSLRRKLTKCNDLPILTITGGLPVKKKDKELVDKMINKNVVLSERKLREIVSKTISKEYTNIGGTKPGIDFIKKVLDDQYDMGAHYDLSDMKQAVLNFAMKSTHNANYCVDRFAEIKWHSDEPAEPVLDYEDKPKVYFDIEVFPNLLIICWKVEGYGKPIFKMINPSSEQVRKLFDMKLVGFNNRNYDNHIIYARGQDYSIPMLYSTSQKIISGDDVNAKFREAYNLSYTDIYDYAAAGNKKSLKKLEIEMAHITEDELRRKGYSEERIKLIKAGSHHQELGLPWDEPVPEELWEKVADYCTNDVVATEAADNYLYADFSAREALVDISGGNVNQTTNTLSQKFIFNENQNPQSEFCYRNMAKPVSYLDPKVKEFLTEACPEMMSAPHGEENSLLPYFPGYTFERGKSEYLGCVAGEGGYVYSEPGLHMNVALLDIASMHPHSTIAECLFGPRYTRNFRDIVEARVCIKHKDWDTAATMLDGKLIPYIEKIKSGEMKAKDLANALKTVINSVYGLTAASFANRFRDERNKDNIVAKRGALFMIELQHAVQRLGYKVAHIKTDSIKIPDATPEIIDFVMGFGRRYGYTFEHEATYERMVLVNKAVYIAKFATEQECIDLYGYAPGENIEEGGEWTATGDEFKIPYTFKTLFSHEPITFKDMCETFQVQKGNLELDFNEDLPDVTAEEKEVKKLESKYKKGELSDTTFERECAQYADTIKAGHDYRFVGRVGEFVPVLDGTGGGVLYRHNEGRYGAASGSKGYRWKEAEIVKANGLEDTIDRRYWDGLVADSVKHISEYCDFEWFVA